MLDSRYDVWQCAKCRAVKTVRSVPHVPQRCCNTGMWFLELRVGPSYQNGIEPLEELVVLPWGMPDIRQLKLL